MAAPIIEVLRGAQRSGDAIVPTQAALTSGRLAYWIQGRVPVAGSSVAAWKIAATSTAGQRHINVEGTVGSAASSSARNRHQSGL